MADSGAITRQTVTDHKSLEHQTQLSVLFKRRSIAQRASRQFLLDGLQALANVICPLNVFVDPARDLHQMFDLDQIVLEHELGLTAKINLEYQMNIKSTILSKAINYPNQKKPQQSVCPVNDSWCITLSLLLVEECHLAIVTAVRWCFGAQVNKWHGPLQAASCFAQGVLWRVPHIHHPWHGSDELGRCGCVHWHCHHAVAVIWHACHEDHSFLLLLEHWDCFIRPIATASASMPLSFNQSLKRASYN